MSEHESINHIRQTYPCLIVPVAPTLGCDIHTFFRECLMFAARNQCRVQASFNGTSVTIHSGDDPMSIYDRWLTRHNEWIEADKCLGIETKTIGG